VHVGSSTSFLTIKFVWNTRPNLPQSRLVSFTYIQHSLNGALLQTDADSYNMFRSDYLHLSVSLTSSLRTGKPRSQGGSSSCHLSPYAFSHFWSWVQLFDRTMSLPIRQGKKWPANMKAQSPKLGRHIATIKYRVELPNLYITHLYLDNSREAWTDGLTPAVGLKGHIAHFQADLHQREEESTVPGLRPGTFRLLRRKPFHTAEVVMRDVELRTMLATFSDPLKQTVALELDALSRSNNYRSYSNLPPVGNSDSRWVDWDDFIDVGWAPSKDQAHKIHLLPTMACPRFTYFKHAHGAENRVHTKISKFGDEDTHVCNLGKEAGEFLSPFSGIVIISNGYIGATEVQIELARARIQELKSKLRQLSGRRADGSEGQELVKKIDLLESYVIELQADQPNRGSYYMSANTVDPEEWHDFDNVYCVHHPKLNLTDSIRDILIQYYHLSQAVRGFEYHLATRAVKFILDQAEVSSTAPETRKSFGDMLGVSNPANAIRKMLNPDHNPRASVLMGEGSTPRPPAATVDPLSGWADGVSLTRSHFLLLLKPQIVLRSSLNDSSVLLAAGQATAQAFAIMDAANADDPVSGKVMTRHVLSSSRFNLR
jgi:hypothetical protein